MPRVLRWAGWTIVLGYFAGATLILTLRYLILPNIDHYRGTIEKAASTAMHRRVTVGAIGSSWQGLRPRLSLRDVNVYDTADTVALTLPEVDATLAWESLIVVEPRLHSLEIVAPDLLVRRDSDNHLSIGGIPVEFGADSEQSQVPRWILAQEQIVIRHAQVRWRDEMRKAPELALSDINLVLQRSGTRHRFGITGTPPASLAAPLDLRGYFDHDLFAASSDANGWVGELYLNLAHVDFAAWHPYFAYPIELTSGSGALQAWVRFAPRKTALERVLGLTDLTADVRLDDVLVRVNPDLPRLAITSVNGRVVLHSTANSDEINLRDFSLTGRDGLDLATANLLARRTFDDAGDILTGQITTDRIDLDTLAQLLERVPLSSALRNLLTSVKPRGQLRHFDVSWRGTPNAPKSYTIASDFVGLSMSSIALGSEQIGDAAARVIPGFSNLTGHLRTTEHEGALSLSSHDATISVPGLLDQPDIPFSRLDGEASWQSQDGELDVQLASLNYENRDAAGTASGSFRQGPQSGSAGPGYLDLTAHMTRADLHRVPAYLPTSMPADVRGYLDRSLISGNCDDVSFRVRGALERFPFRQAAGAARPASGIASRSFFGNGEPPPEEFRIAGKLHAARYEYAPRPGSKIGDAPQWPLLDPIEGELLLDRTRLEIRARTANVLAYQLTNVRAELPDLDDHNEVLKVTGQGNGPFSELLQFVNASPVANWTGHFTNDMHAVGNTRLELSLELPLANMDAAKVSGSVQMLGNDITLFGWLPPLAHSSGELAFSEEGIALHGVIGEFLGAPFKLESGPHADHSIDITGEGGISVAGLRRMRDWPVLEHLSERIDGTSRFTLAVHVPTRPVEDPAAGARVPRLTLDSRLVGLSSDLPEPMKKTAAENWPAHFEMLAPQGKPGEQTDEMRLRVGAFAMTVLRRQNGQGDFQISQVAYGVNEPAKLSDARANLALSLKALDLDAWQRVANALSGTDHPGALTAPDSAIAAFVPEVISGHVDSLHLWDKQFDKVVLDASHSGPAWQLKLASDQVTGQVSWRLGAYSGNLQNRITARLTRLSIPQSAARDVDNLLDSSPQDIPALDVIADNFELRDKKFGHLEVLASNTASSGKREWRLEKLVLSNPDGSLDAQGSWGPDSATPGSPARTRLGFTVTSGNVGGLLDRLGLKGTVSQGSATLKGDINWIGSPISLDYGTLAGTMNLEVKDGQFLKADPGVAKLLGVLSLQGLTRRLSFDFSDIFGSGFAFDKITADVKITDGVASTSNFGMDGPSADVGISGSADLARETQDLRIFVVPKINTNAASLLLLANPAVAVGSFFFSEVIKGQLSNIFRVEYNVTGPWESPVFTKIERQGILPGPSNPSASGRQ